MTASIRFLYVFTDCPHCSGVIAASSSSSWWMAAGPNIKNFPIHCPIHCSFNFMKSARTTTRWENTPCHNVFTSKLHCRYSVVEFVIWLLATFEAYLLGKSWCIQYLFPPVSFFPLTCEWVAVLSFVSKKCGLTPTDPYIGTLHGFLCRQCVWMGDGKAHHKSLCIDWY